MPEGRKVCSGKCRATLSRRREEARAERDLRLRRLGEEAIRLLQENGG